MIKFNLAPDCGNSPRSAFIKNFNIAFVENNTDFLIDCVHENIQWKIYGDKKIDGKTEFIKTLQHMMMSDIKVDKIIIHSIITHGKKACSNGERIMKDGKKFVFCDVYEFISAGKNKISKLYSYVLEDSL